MGIFNRRKEKTMSLSTEQVYNLITTGTYGNEIKVTDAYTQIPIVNACVSTKASNLSRVPLRLYKGDTLVESGPVYNLFKYPNPQMTQAEFVFWFDANINLNGNAYAYWDDEKAGIPVALIFTNQVKPLTSDAGWINQYEIQKDNSTIRREREMVLHAKYFSHNSQTVGIGPLSALRQKVELTYAADKYNAKFFTEDATPSTAFSTDRPLSPKEFDELKHRLIDRRRGSRETMILHGGLKVEQLGISQKDADFVNLYRLTREEICAVFGVPESEINIFTETKFANAAVGSLAFWEKTLIPEGNLITEAINRQILRDLGLECRFDFNQVDAISRAGYGERVDQAVKLINVGFGVNEVNEILKLGFDPDVPRERPSMGGLFGGSPAGGSEEESENGSEEMDDEAKSFDAFKMAQAAKWRKYEKAKGSLAARMRKSLKDYFHKVERKILSVVGSGKGAGWTVKKDVDEGEIAAAFNDDELDDAIAEFLKAAFIAGAEDIAGVTLNAALTQRYLQEKLIKVHVVNETARHQVIERIRSALAASLERGDDYRQRATMIKLAIEDSMAITQGRAETIARTELGSAYNHAGYQAAADNGAIGVRWIATPDELTRDSHADYDGHVELGGELFGGKIAYPGDPNAPPEEVINCRCAFEPVYQGDI